MNLETEATLGTTLTALACTAIMYAVMQMCTQGRNQHRPKD